MEKFITSYSIDDNGTLHTFIGDLKHITFSNVDSIFEAELLIEEENMERNPKDRGYGYKKSYNYEDSIKESKGAKNYFDDLKYYYTKTLPHLNKNEKEEYKQLAKDFFSNLKLKIKQ